jgi:CTP synthase (UTP-ammonia lyase)
LTAGDLGVIAWARQVDLPIFGTCGGFQYMVIEYVRNVLGHSAVSHAETDPQNPQALILPLSCSLKGKSEMITVPDKASWLFKTTGRHELTGHYFCSYGLHAEDRHRVEKGAMWFTAFSPDGDPRALELKGHTFFQGTLFQPSLDCTAESPNALIMDFLLQCERSSQGR